MMKLGLTQIPRRHYYKHSIYIPSVTHLSAIYKVHASGDMLTRYEHLPSLADAFHLSVAITSRLLVSFCPARRLTLSLFGK